MNVVLNEIQERSKEREAELVQKIMGKMYKRLHRFKKKKTET